jgi:hypothetical protein
MIAVFACEVCHKEFRLDLQPVSREHPGKFGRPDLSSSVWFHGIHQIGVAKDVVCGPCGVAIGNAIRDTMKSLSLSEGGTL